VPRISEVLCKVAGPDGMASGGGGSLADGDFLSLFLFPFCRCCLMLGPAATRRQKAGEHHEASASAGGSRFVNTGLFAA